MHHRNAVSSLVGCLLVFGALAVTGASEASADTNKLVSQPANAVVCPLPLTSCSALATSVNTPLATNVVVQTNVQRHLQAAAKTRLPEKPSPYTREQVFALRILSAADPIFTRQWSRVF